MLAIGALSFARSQSSAGVARSCLYLCDTHDVAVSFVYILLLANRRFEIGRFRLLLSARSWFLEPVSNGPHFYIGSNQKMILTANYIKYSEFDIIYDQLTSRNASDDRGPLFDGFCNRSSTSTFLCYLRFNQVPHQPMVSYHPDMPSAKLYSSANQIHTEVDTIKWSLQTATFSTWHSCLIVKFEVYND